MGDSVTDASITSVKTSYDDVNNALENLLGNMNTASSSSTSISGAVPSNSTGTAGVSLYTDASGNVEYVDAKNGARQIALQSSVTALAATIASGPFSGNLAAPGWTKLPNGLILQWGHLTYTAITSNFPVTFPNACFVLLATNADSQGTYVDNTFGYYTSTSQFFIASKASSTGWQTGSPAYWLAIGN